jgi:MATE family multidrug resistance protein
MNKLMDKFWRGPGGGAAVLNLAIPLIISIGSESVLMFTDRMFLSWYNTDAMAAAMQAGIASYGIASLFYGTVSYVNTFVAQYTGASQNNKIGPVVWQGIFIAIVAGVLLLFLIPVTGQIFLWMGHSPDVQEYEIIYFQIMCVNALPMLIAAALGGFFTGRGDTRTVMWVNLAGAGLNIVLDYILIFGRFGFPRWGVAGAAWATFASSVFTVAVYFYIFTRHQHREKFSTIQGFGFDGDITRRLLRYGLPNGMQFMLDICAFAAFIMFVGRISNTALAATSIAFGINTLAFMPMLGIGVAVTTLVGQSLGRNEPSVAAKTTWSGFFITYVYMASIAAGYWFFPKVFLYPFSIGASDYAAIEPMAINLLAFVAFYCLFDSGNIIFSAALKGAGDTRFVMFITIILGWLFMVVPTWLLVRAGYGVYWAWSFATAYVSTLAIVFLLRFLAGKWKNMRVIEIPPPKLPPRAVAVPPARVEAG